MIKYQLIVKKEEKKKKKKNEKTSSQVFSKYDQLHSNKDLSL